MRPSLQRSRRGRTRDLTVPERALRAAYLAGVRGPLELADPAPVLAARAATAPAPQLALATVYRRRNAETVSELLDELPRSAVVQLWALDEPDPGLADVTLGTGPGPRLTLLNRLLAALPAGDRWTVIADDDVRFVRGSAPRLAALAAAAGLDVAQPAHDRLSKVNHPATRVRPLRIARETRFVEAGPLVLLSPRARAALVPLPERLGMGWGVEATWAARADLRLGIVDAVRMRHLERTAAGYDASAQRVQEEQELAAHGFAGWTELQRATSQWWAWRRARESP